MNKNLLDALKISNGIKIRKYKVRMFNFSENTLLSLFPDRFHGIKIGNVLQATMQISASNKPISVGFIIM